MSSIKKAISFETLYECNDGVTVCIVAATNRGKTELAKTIIRQNEHHFDWMWIFTSGASYKQYRNFFYPSHINIINSDNKKSLGQTVSGFCQQLNTFNEYLEQQHKKPLKTLLVIDDLSEQLSDINALTKTRHLKLSLLILMHNPTNIITDQRDQVTHWFLNQTLTLNLNVFKPITVTFKDFVASRSHESTKYEYMLWKDNIVSTCYSVRIDSDDLKKNNDHFISDKQFSFEQLRIRNLVEGIQEKNEEMINDMFQ